MPIMSSSNGNGKIPEDDISLCASPPFNPFDMGDPRLESDILPHYLAEQSSACHCLNSGSHDANVSTTNDSGMDMEKVSGLEAVPTRPLTQLKRRRDTPGPPAANPFSASFEPQDCQRMPKSARTSNPVDRVAASDPYPGIQISNAGAYDYPAFVVHTAAPADNGSHSPATPPVIKPRKGLAFADYFVGMMLYCKEQAPEVRHRIYDVIVQGSLAVCTASLPLPVTLGMLYPTLYVFVNDSRRKPSI